MRMPFRLPPLRVIIAVVAMLAVSAVCFEAADRAPKSKGTQRSIERAHAEGRIASWRQYSRVWMPRVARANGWAALAVAGLLPLAMRRREAAAGLPPQKEASDSPAPSVSSDLRETAAAEKRWRRLGWCGVTFIALVAAWSNAPRLTQSLWGDEENTMRWYVAGRYVSEQGKPPEFFPAQWGDTFFHYRNPNNHVLYSITARLAHELFAKPAIGALDTYFSAEWPIRLPAFLAGIGAFFSLAWLGAALGWRRAGWVAAALLALHPWMVRYGTEARGYAYLLAAMPVLIASLFYAVRTGRWRWWVLAAFMEFTLLYTWPLSLHAVAAANLSAVLALWWKSGLPVREKAAQSLRWLITGLVAGMAFFQVFIPQILQFKAYLARDRAAGSITDGSGLDALTALFTGREWRDDDPSNPLLTPWAREWAQHPWLAGLVAAFMLLLLAAGLRRAWQENGGALRPWLIALLLPAPLVLAHCAVGKNLLLSWYLMPALPGLLLVLAAGVEALATRLSPKPWAQAAAMAAACALFALPGAPRRETLRQHDIEPNRAAALLVQPVLNPRHPDYQKHAITGCFLMQISAYDPGLRVFDTPEEMDALIAETEATGRDFYVAFGHMSFAREALPAIIARLENPEEFEHIATLHGLESYTTRHVYRHRKKTAAAGGAGG